MSAIHKIFVADDLMQRCLPSWDTQPSETVEQAFWDAVPELAGLRLETVKADPPHAVFASGDVVDPVRERDRLEPEVALRLGRRMPIAIVHRDDLTGTERPL